MKTEPVEEKLERVMADRDYMFGRFDDLLDEAAKLAVEKRPPDDVVRAVFNAITDVNKYANRADG